MDFSFPKNSNDPVKFDLFVKTHEIKQIGQSLQHIMLLPKKERLAWVKAHESFLNQFLEEFMVDASDALDGMSLDQETMQLSIDFVMHLRQTMNALNSILSERKQLKS